MRDGPVSVTSVAGLSLAYVLVPIPRVHFVNPFSITGPDFDLYAWKTSIAS